jgi:type III secretion system needle length determinant
MLSSPIYSTASGSVPNASSPATDPVSVVPEKTVSGLSKADAEEFSEQLEGALKELENPMLEQTGDALLSNDAQEGQAEQVQQEAEPNAEDWLSAMLGQQQLQLHARDTQLAGNSMAGTTAADVVLQPSAVNPTGVMVTISPAIVGAMTEVVADGRVALNPTAGANTQLDVQRNGQVLTATADTAAIANALRVPDPQSNTSIPANALQNTAEQSHSQQNFAQGNIAQDNIAQDNIAQDNIAQDNIVEESTRETAAALSNQNFASNRAQDANSPALLATAFTAARLAAKPVAATNSERLDQSLANMNVNSSAALATAKAAVSLSANSIAEALTAQSDAPIGADSLIRLMAAADLSTDTSAAFPPSNHLTTAGTEAAGRTAAAALNLQTPESRLGEQLLHTLRDQVQLQIQQKMQNATIRLDPPELGSLEIYLSHEAGRLNVHITASQADVARLIQSTSDRLRHELAGAQFTQVNVQTSAEGQSGQQQSRERQRFMAGDSILANEQSIHDRPTNDRPGQRRSGDVLASV